MPKHASKQSLQESTTDCLNWQQSQKQKRTCHWTKSAHNTSMKHAGLVTKKAPTLTEQLQHNEEANTLQQAKDNSNNKSSKSECNNISMKPKSLSNLAKNWTHATNALQPNSMTQIHPQSTNVKEKLQHHPATEGTPISAIKTFATKNCAMCDKETIAILKQSRSNPQFHINFNNEICGACRHKPHFHRHAKQTPPNTEESINDKTVSPTHKVATDFASCNVCLADV